MARGKKILVAPLDWGLGHATRCTSLIRKLEMEGHEVWIGATGSGLAFLKKQYPKNNFLDSIPAYNISYNGQGSFQWQILRQVPKILRAIRAEHQWLDRAIELEKFEEVYSDNRYGLWSKKIPCHFITHQIFVRVPWYGKWGGHFLVKYFISKYTTCLIPDTEGENNLSGELSHGEIPKNCKYVGWLSRFDRFKADEKKFASKEYDVAVLLSGPEPQRGILEKKLFQILEEGNLKAIIICGQPEQYFDETKNGVRRISHLEDDEFVEVLLRSQNIVCRSGYSTLMDLHFLGKKAILIPTPGQTEQEYLARYLGRKGWRSLEQKELTLQNLLVLMG
jgi:uncharacterized protein (TIGR00661 family)